MDIFRDTWLPTDIGLMSPALALSQSHQICWPRSDWNAASLMLLQAMLQTAVVLGGHCENRSAWRRHLYTTPHNLEQWFDCLGSGVSAWQCVSAEFEVEVAEVLPETPSRNSIKKSSDILYWQQNIPNALSVAEASIAIISDQLWGVPSGRGYREGCRGRRPMTSLLMYNNSDVNIWKQIWLNVLPCDEWCASYPTTHPFQYPWVRQRYEDSITPQNAHSLEVLWQMPRRWRIVVEDDGSVRRLMHQSYGFDYHGWSHPLSGYIAKSEQVWLPQRMEPYFSFKYWALLTTPIADRSRPPAALTALTQFSNVNPIDLSMIQLRCFGWSLGDSDALGAWVDFVAPVFFNAQPSVVQAAIDLAGSTYERLALQLKLINNHFEMDALQLYQRLDAEFYRRVKEEDWTDWGLVLRRVARLILWDKAGRNRRDVSRISKGIAKL